MVVITWERKRRYNNTLEDIINKEVGTTPISMHSITEDNIKDTTEAIIKVTTEVSSRDTTEDNSKDTTEVSSRDTTFNNRPRHPEEPREEPLVNKMLHQRNREDLLGISNREDLLDISLEDLLISRDLSMEPIEGTLDLNIHQRNLEDLLISRDHLNMECLLDRNIERLDLEDLEVLLSTINSNLLLLNTTNSVRHLLHVNMVIVRVLEVMLHLLWYPSRLMIRARNVSDRSMRRRRTLS